MAMVFIKKRDFKSKMIVPFLCMLFMSCCHKNDIPGSIIPKYKIINECLDSLTSLLLLNNMTIKTENKIVVMELNKLENDTIDVAYSFHIDGDYVRNTFINNKNKRVIGYIDKEDLDILVFSDIDDYNELKTLSSLITEDVGNKKFEYLFISPTAGFDFESMYEPLYWHFKYIDGKISQPTIHF